MAVTLVALLTGCSSEPALPATFSVLDGQQIGEAIKAQSGQVVVLNFWATWCVPCREEFPALVALDEQYRDKGVRVIAVSVDDIEEIDGKVRPFVESLGAGFLIWVKAVGDPMDFMDAINPELSGAIPETIIYDREGNVAHILTGEQTFEQFEAAVRPLL